MAQKKPEVQMRCVGGIWYEASRKKVKNLNIHVRRDGYLAERAQWVREAQQRQKQRAARDAQPLPDKAEALAYFTAMSDKVYPAFAEVLGGQKPVLKVRSMTSCWGVCCPGKRRITLALQLYNQPPAAQIYVVVHEYCHFLQLNHSPAFWAEVEKLLPDWKARRELLKK